MSVPAAFVRESRIRRRDVLVKDRVESSSPRLRDRMLRELSTSAGVLSSGNRRKGQRDKLTFTSMMLLITV